jgi:hypothetical protein
MKQVDDKVKLDNCAEKTFQVIRNEWWDVYVKSQYINRRE